MNLPKKMLIGSDHAGFALKEALIKHLVKKGIKVRDEGTCSIDSCDYTDFAAIVAGKVSRKRFSRGILICKSGIGNSIIANRFPGVRAALCYNKEVAKLCREHNDSNILVLGAGFVPPKDAKEMVDIWLKTDFTGGRHKRRLDKIKKTEELIRGDRF